MTSSIFDLPNRKLVSLFIYFYYLYCISRLQNRKCNSSPTEIFLEGMQSINRYGCGHIADNIRPERIQFSRNDSLLSKMIIVFFFYIKYSVASLGFVSPRDPIPITPLIMIFQVGIIFTYHFRFIYYLPDDFVTYDIPSKFFVKIIQKNLIF